MKKLSASFAVIGDLLLQEKLHKLAIRRIKTLPLPTILFLSAAPTHDLTALKQANPLILTTNLFADKVYADADLKPYLQLKGITLLTLPKKKKVICHNSTSRCGQSSFLVSNN